MYNIDEKNFWIAIEHIGRYSYASWFVNKRNYENVLDVACSNGYGCSMMAKTAKKVVGVDANEQFIDEAEQRNIDKSNVNFHSFNVDKDDISKNLEESKFCVITCFETLEHINHPQEFLSQLKRLMKKDGRILLSVPAGEYEPINDDGEPKNPHHKHVFDDKRINMMFKKAGLEIELLLGQSMINQLMRQHNSYCSRNVEMQEHTTSNFLISSESVEYYTYMFAYPIKDEIENSYSRIYVLKHKK